MAWTLYVGIIWCSRDRTKRDIHPTSGTDLAHAAKRTQRWLQSVRRSRTDGTAWDRWTVATPGTPTTPTVVLAYGTVDRIVIAQQGSTACPGVDG